ncbi:zinc metallo protease RseP [Haloferula helveola]|uniref:Zinc metalloprotease n=1 Tax=Haloferula helveola TaxID=490095 RepID=A0ABM7RAN0_9BACT|nr:zinc metallo protease RseP [Haloferula helveola]
MFDPGPLTTALLILLVIMIFNVIIFVHELGHFWAAKWRGLKIDRFQIWFGKPIWKKTINGVQYGLGWIPAGGFVALPQMAPMEAIEGDNRDAGEPLPPISPLDKIIVAFAGPLFSFLLAFVCSLMIWKIGRPLEVLPTTEVGWVEAGSPAEKAGFQRGDTILAIDGEPVSSWDGSLDSIRVKIITSRNEKIRFTVNRPGVGELDLVSGYTIPETSWWERRATREVGIEWKAGPVQLLLLDAENSPAKLAGVKEGDVALSLNGTEIVARLQFLELLEDNGDKPVELVVERTEESGEKVTKTLTIQPAKPLNPTPDIDRYMIGVTPWGQADIIDTLEYPNPKEQITGTLQQMWLTVRSVASPKSSIGIQHLSGPIGISKIQFFSLLMEHPLRRILGFMVLININLALLNLLPFPVLDGGHITIATMEAIARRPVNVKFLEVLQMGFVFLLFGIMLYVSSKDLFDDFGVGGGEAPKIEFAEPG